MFLHGPTTNAMDVRKTVLLLAILFFTLEGPGQEKEIVLDLDLVSNSSAFKVKSKGNFAGNISKYRFANFNLIAGKSGWINSSRSSKIWSSEAKNLTENKFSFILFNGQSDTATVNALSIIITEFSKSMELFSSENFSFSTGGAEFNNGSELFTASISTSYERNDDWVLRMEAEEDEVSYREVKTTLENGTRTIRLKQVTSPYKQGSNTIPALGYEFIENEIAIGAVKYFPGTIGYRKVWFRSSLEEQTQLVLAAAMATILHLKE